jgi:DNA polymerase-3 subunit gamma/tau
MAYVALYRKYRSQSFDELIGQQHITTVLRNAIRLGRIAHAYLFCGPRGCGKTSTARLVARAINCQHGDGPTPDPCGECAMCVQIRQGSAMDVTEMDAASETGIDDVREKIIENAKYAPTQARYKVYIIDEVHDLSLKAFDSLLKTIEEPPPHVVFILATTEAHKVPITVRSRCQRMDFRRGNLEDLAGNIRRVLDAESIPYEIEAVSAVARAAEGSFRDSLSLLEQALAYTDGKLTAEAVHASVGTVGPELLDAVTETLAADDRAQAFLKAGELVDSGKDVKQTLAALQLHLRDLLVAHDARSPQALADVSPERFAKLKEQARWFTPPQLLQMLKVLADTERDLRFSNQHRLLLERAFWSILPSSLTAQPVAPSTTPVAAPARPAPAPPPRAATAPPPPVEEPVRPAPPPTADTSSPEPPAQPPAPVEAALAPPGKVDEADEADDSRFAGDIDLVGLRRIWPRVMRRLLQKSRSAQGIFTDDVQVTALDGRFVVLTFPNEFQRSRADKPKGREALEQALTAETGIQGFKVRCLLLDEEAPPPSPPVMEEPPASLVDLPMESSPTSNGVSSGAFGELPAVRPATDTAVVSAPPPPPVTQSPDLNEDEAFLKLVMEELDARPADE